MVYCRGSDNIIADFLSRNPEGKFYDEIENKIIIATLHEYSSPIENTEITALRLMLINSDKTSMKTIIKNLKLRQRQDENVNKIIIEIVVEKKNIENYYIYEEILFHKAKNNENWRIEIPEDMRKDIIIATYDQLGHVGTYKTVSYLKNYYYWRSLSRDIKKCVRACDLCERVKYLSIAMEGEYKWFNQMDLIT